MVQWKVNINPRQIDLFEMSIAMEEVFGCKLIIFKVRFINLLLLLLFLKGKDHIL